MLSRNVYHAHGAFHLHWKLDVREGNDVPVQQVRIPVPAMSGIVSYFFDLLLFLYLYMQNIMSTDRTVRKTNLMRRR